MSIDDRIRAATQAAAATVREIRPLVPPLEDSPARPGRPRFWGTGFRRTGFRSTVRGWLIPLAAAVTVIAVAATLVLVRNPPRTAGQPGTGPAASRSAGPAATAAPADPEALPGYFVAIQGLDGNPGTDQRPDSAIVGETLTGTRIATITPAAGGTFVGVTGAADDRTFVLDSAAIDPGSLFGPETAPRTWYLLKVRPGATRVTTMTRLSFPLPSAADVNGIALSPDGTKLAIFYQTAGKSVGFPYSGPFTLGIYSVATGAALRTWTDANPSHGSYGYGSDEVPDPNANLTWTSNGQRLAFVYSNSVGPGASIYLREVNVAGPGGGLLTDSTMAATIAVSTVNGKSKIWCDSLGITGDGRSAVCGAELPATPPVGATLDALTEPARGLTGCSASTYLGYGGLAEISLAGDRLARVLYEDKPKCTGAGNASVLWSSPSGGTVLGVVSYVDDPQATEHSAIVLYRQGTVTTVGWPGAAGTLLANEVAF